MILETSKYSGTGPATTNLPTRLNVENWFIRDVTLGALIMVGTEVKLDFQRPLLWDAFRPTSRPDADFLIDMC